MEQKIGTIVVAAGHGTLRDGTSKLVETVDIFRRMSMIGQVLDTVRGLEECLPQFLVLNGRFERQIAKRLERDAPAAWRTMTVVHQTQRRGAADAVRVAMLADLGASHADAYLVVYGDMPLWRPNTLARLSALHRSADNRPVISMVTVSLAGAASPRVLERYGRVLRDARGRIVNVVEPGDARPADIAVTSTVNPSLYVIDRRWFLARYNEIPPYRRADGFGDELHLPPLLAVAAREEAPVAELHLDDPEEALGVNNEDELHEVRRIFIQRTTQKEAAQT